ncbi:hypothetical protein SAMN05421740_105290 [Parapedobacter koreensis]|uniref:DUF4352 domain-containing protein n=2 Tax=Parapedobacter koreensis TaxID=332977 RepID=A0A1H7QBJ4_9SPHI|nr:hypothetical protein SAMN05421740_105290 [Parapedobacter koreensis]
MLSSALAVSARLGADIAVVRDSNVLVIDDIRIETERFVVDSATNTATVELSLSSLKENPRELKINVYGTQLVDNERNAYYFSTIALGRVLMRFDDKQNYLNYLLQPNTPAKLIITAEKILPGATIQVVKIVLEDSAEEGRFLDAYLSYR